MSRSVTQTVLNPLAACAARCRRMLGALGRLGKRRMRGLGSSPDVAAKASAFIRMARALRLLAVLELRVRTLLIQGPAAPAAAALSPVAEAKPPKDERLSDRKDAGQDCDPVERPERPERETFPSFDFDTLLFEDARPLTEIAVAVCRDFGLSPEATERAKAPFAELEALLAGKPPPPKPARPSMDRARPRAPLLETAEPSDAKSARVDARGPRKPP